MLRKILAALVLVPLAIVIVGLAVANRQMVTISFDPFDAAHPAYALTAPLFVLVLLLVIVGVIIGGIAAWLKQSKWRRMARHRDDELRAARAEADSLRAQLAAAEASGPGGSSMMLRPPAA